MRGPYLVEGAVRNCSERPRVLRSESVRLVINPSVIDMMEAMASECSPNETGGILYGTRSRSTILLPTARREGINLAVVGMIPAPADSLHKPDRFERGTDGLEAAWLPVASQGLVYLGEWHSHPSGVAAPSGEDYAALESVLGDEGYGSPSIALGIVIAPGDLQNEWSLGAFYVETTVRSRMYATSA